ncbi:MAG TPA: FAD:protein FMN transferase [Firmicutes bacterium]|nr:FAD:protein FMN transferase [Bacillota bacterium]HHT43658.1 FAD:protein FMN transferase [Bacillota bacterium]
MNGKGLKNRRALFVALALVVLGGAAAVSCYLGMVPQAKAQESTTTSSMILMDTVVDVRVDGPRSASLVERVFARMEELERVFSRFIEESEVSEINRRAGEWVEVSPLTLELVELGIEMGRITEGAFDITIGAVLDLWGFGSDFHRVPTEEELADALATVDYTRVEVDGERGAVRIPQGTVLDLGGIAKGFIIHQATAILREAQVDRSMVNAGGDISVVGRRPDGRPWRVGVQDPEDPRSIRYVLPLDDQSVVTSGDYQRYFVVDGVRYHHIIDPFTGYPARGLRSVTIVGDNPAVCDAISTAVFVLGWERGRALVESLPGVEAIIISETGAWISPGLAQAMLTQ